MWRDKLLKRYFVPFRAVQIHAIVLSISVVVDFKSWAMSRYTGWQVGLIGYIDNHHFTHILCEKRFGLFVKLLLLLRLKIIVFLIDLRHSNDGLPDRQSRTELYLVFCIRRLTVT